MYEIERGVEKKSGELGIRKGMFFYPFELLISRIEREVYDDTNV